jgi:UDP-N-acetylmuramate dehydrogenase
MIDIQDNVSLSSYSTLGVGGSADKLVVIRSSEELVEALEFANNSKIPFVVIGSGSNLLFSDRGFAGLVIVNKASHYEINGTKVSAGSGSNLSAIARDALNKGLLGFEFGAGIPGTVGAAIIGNVGTSLGHISDILVSVDVWNKGKVKTVSGESLEFDYRFSNLKNKPDYIVISAKFQLEKGDNSDALELVKKDAARRAGSYRGRTAGSYFKNPREGRTAAEMIDSLGLKGYKIGGAEVSTDHANVFRNAGDATAKDFVELEQYVISKVMEKFDITLIPEVVKIGIF